MTNESETRPFAMAPDAGRAYWSLGGLFNIKAAGTDTRDGFALCEAIMTKMADAPLHVHHGEDEAWYVLEGKITFHVGEQVLEAGPGTFVFAPKDVPHRFSVDIEPTRVLVIASPGGGFEKVVEEGGVAAEQAQGPLLPDPQKLMELGEKYRFEILGPPPGAGIA